MQLHSLVLEKTMKKTIVTAAVLAAFAAPVMAGGLDPIVEGAPILEPVSEAIGSSGSIGSAGGVLPALLLLGLLAAATSGSN